jgi:hypothetical protein
MRILVSLALCFAFGSVSVPTQEARAGKPAAPPAMHMPKPGPEMARLQAFVGNWNVEENHEPGLFGPGGKDHGVAPTHLGPGGLSFLVDFKSSGGAMTKVMTLVHKRAKAEPKKWSGPPCAPTPAQKPGALAPGF